MKVSVVEQGHSDGPCKDFALPRGELPLIRQSLDSVDDRHDDHREQRTRYIKLTIISINVNLGVKNETTQ